MRYIIPFILLFSSAVKANRIDIFNISFNEVNNILDLGYEKAPNSDTIGYYRKSSNLLDGEFQVISHITGISEFSDYPFEFLDSVTGVYDKNEKSGLWVYRHILDDAVDLFADYFVTIKFESGSCVESGFYGKIGHVMPFTKHVFQSSELCSPNSIVHRAWKLWEIEYNEKQ